MTKKKSANKKKAGQNAKRGKGAYSISYMKDGKKKTEFFSKLPTDDRRYYVARGYRNPEEKGKRYIKVLTDSGTSLIPLKKTKK